MKGFDPDYRDFPDFLHRTAQEVLSRDGPPRHHHPAVILRRPEGIAYGPDQAAREWLYDLAAFPDRAMMSEEVIWSGSAQVGYFGSHRVLSEARHLGAGRFGAPTGRAVRYREITDSYAKAGQISDVWQIRDTGAVLRHLGLDPMDWARGQLATMDVETQPFRPAIDSLGPYTGEGTGNQWGLAFEDILTRLLSGDFAVLDDQYDPACEVAHPSGTGGHGPRAAEAFWIGLRAAFPSAQVQVHHRLGMEEPLMPARAAVRWSLEGRHDGWGTFGAPTGAQVHVMGISHAEFGPGGLRREWTLIDAAAIWMQILAHRG